jgi:hypothetical protein
MDCNFADVDGSILAILAMETDNVDLALRIDGVQVLLDELATLDVLQVSRNEFFSNGHSGGWCR